MGNIFSLDSDIVHNMSFESAVLKIINNKESQMTVMDKIEGSELRVCEQPRGMKKLLSHSLKVIF